MEVLGSTIIVRINLNPSSKQFQLKEVCWSFLAKTYEKSPCDGIGITVKHLLSRDSFQLGSGKYNH